MRLVICLAVAGCQQSAPTATPPPGGTPAEARAPAPASHVPFVIGNRLVADDGRVIRTLGAGPGAIAIPNGPHRFVLDGHLVDAAADSVTTWRPPAALVSSGDHEARLVRYEPDGRERWSVAVKGVRSVRPPDVAAGGGRVVAAIDGEIRAFDDATGTPAWKVPVWGARLQVAGDALYAIDCNEPTNEHWLIGYALADGKERFRAPLTRGCDPSVAVVGGGTRIVVVDEPANETAIFDLAGREITRLAERVEGWHDEPGAAAFGSGPELVLVTENHVTKLDGTGTVRWQLGAPRSTFVGGNDLVELPGGDLVLANYGAIADSGVELMRIRGRDGTVVWRSHAAALGVAHSQYLHLAYIEVRGASLYVVSQGSYGGFLERLSVTTGVREQRCVLDDPGGCKTPAPG